MLEGLHISSGLEMSGGPSGGAGNLVGESDIWITLLNEL